MVRLLCSATGNTVYQASVMDSGRFHSHGSCFITLMSWNSTVHRNASLSFPLPLRDSRRILQIRSIFRLFKSSARWKHQNKSVEAQAAQHYISCPHFSVLFLLQIKNSVLQEGFCKDGTCLWHSNLKGEDYSPSSEILAKFPSSIFWGDTVFQAELSKQVSAGADWQFLVVILMKRFLWTSTASFLPIQCFLPNGLFQRVTPLVLTQHMLF